MEQPTKQQTEILILISPKPYGNGLKLTQAAKLLHLSYHKAKYALSKFKKQYPERWLEIEKLKELSKEDIRINKEHKKALNHPILIGALDWGNDPNVSGDLQFDNNEFGDIKNTVCMKIKEKF